MFREFAPDPDMQLYGRGIRRRLAPMLGGDRRRIELAYSLQLTMPGTPVIRYGEEIGMGDNLDLPEREAIRTPMQWDGTRGAGFSRADPERFVAPLVAEGPYSYEQVNVTNQRLDPNSLLTWFERTLHARRECEEIGSGEHEVIDAGPAQVMVHRATGRTGSTLFVHNLADRPMPSQARRLCATRAAAAQLRRRLGLRRRGGTGRRSTWRATATAGSGCAGRQEASVSEPELTAWWQSGVIYQIYPRSFADANGDGVGDLRGIMEHLDYLNNGTDDSLGVAAIWLSPFYRSPMADFGYDIADYTDVDPIFGTLGDFDDLLGEAHRRGIKVIVDWVPNHTSDQHPWFIESASSRDSAKRDWYVWRDPAPDGGPPNNWQSAFAAVGPAWTFHEPTGQYYLHSFMPHQPDLNWDNPEVEAAMHDVLRFWLNRGVDGFRIDVIYKIAKDPELRDNEPGLPPRRGLAHHPRTPARDPRASSTSTTNRMIVGEVYLLDLHRLVEYINTGDQLHLAHNFVFFHLPWRAAAFRASVQEFTELAEHSGLARLVPGEP